MFEMEKNSFEHRTVGQHYSIRHAKKQNELTMIDQLQGWINS